MSIPTLALSWLEQEARALLTRLERVRSFALTETMVPAAAISPAAQRAIEIYLGRAKRVLRTQILEFIDSLHHQTFAVSLAQQQFTMLRLRFNAVLTQLDIFVDAISQRAEAQNGVWLAGLDAAASDALNLEPDVVAPPLICYLDRGHGAAIRRARTRLPGGGENPVAIVRVPRERMVGSGIASSLVHEVGHQAAALLGLIPSVTTVLEAMTPEDPFEAIVWKCWERWISEVLADFWSVAKLGITSSLGLMAVVSLPRYFVFRVSLNDPHPTPWIRVKLSCAIGQRLYPHPQWERLAQMWEEMYPVNGLPESQKIWLQQLEQQLPILADVLAQQQPSALKGKALTDVLEVQKRQPARLQKIFIHLKLEQLQDLPPTLAFALLGQARWDAQISPEQESQWVSRLLTHWALRRALEQPCNIRTERNSLWSILPSKQM